MDVDATRLGGSLTDDEKRKLMQDNKCFYCKEVGHRAKQCFRKPRQNPTNACITKIKDNDDASSTSSGSTTTTNTSLMSDGLAAQLRTMAFKERSALFDQMIAKDLDF